MLLRHSLLYAMGRGVPGIVNFLAVAVYTRLLAPETYGHYTLVVTAALLGNALLFKWLRLGLLRFLPAHADRPDRLLATLAAGFLALLVPIAVTAGLVPLLSPPTTLRTLIALSCLLLVAQAWFELNLALAQSRLEPLRYGVLALVRAVLGLALGAGLVILGFGALGPVLGLTIAMALGTLVVTGSAWRVARPTLADRALLGRLLVYGLPLSASFALTFVVSSSDRFLLAWLIDSAAAGVYAAGYDIAAAAITVATMSVSLAGFPLAVRKLEQEGLEAARDQLRRNLLLLLAIALPAATGLAMLAPGIARVMLGAAFRETAIAIIPWIALANLLASLRTYLDLGFQLGHRTLRQTAVMATAALVNVALNLWWIPLLGPMGAAYATVAAYAVAFVLSWHLARRVFPLPAPSPEALKVVAATSIMALALWPWRESAGAMVLAGQVVLGGGVYAAVLLALDLAGVRGRLRARFGRRPQPIGTMREASNSPESDAFTNPRS